MQLPKVGDIVEFINKSKEQDRFYLVIKNTYERYYGIVNIATGKRMNWNIGWTDLADDHHEKYWRIIHECQTGANLECVRIQLV